MISTFHGIELGKRGIVAHQSALNTTGHNLANVNNPNYSRQKVSIEATLPIYNPSLNRDETAGQIGSGANVQQILRVRDSFIDNRIIDEKGSLGYWKQKDFFLRQIESLNNEPSLASLKNGFQKFVDSWNRVANYPTEGGSREALREKANALTHDIRSSYDNLHTLRNNADNIIRAKVTEVNNFIKQIADLNKEIRTSKAVGDNPNDLMDKRDALVDKMADLMDVRVARGDEDEFIVYIGAERIVQGDKYYNLKVEDNYNNDGMAKIVWESDSSDIQIKKGEIAGLMDIRDIDIKSQIVQLDNFAINLIETVNEIHRDGFGLNNNTKTNFFKQNYITNASINGDFDKNADGVYDSTGIYKVSGTLSLKKNDIVGSNGIINLGTNKGSDIVVNYYNSDSVGDVINKINNSGADVVAYLNHKGQLTLKATKSSDPQFKDFVIRHMEDSGNFLTGFTGLLENSGVEGAFDWNRTNEVSKLKGLEENYSRSPFSHPSSWIALDEAIKIEVNNIAAAGAKDNDGDGIADRVTGENDGTNALRILAALVSENEHNKLGVLKSIDHDAVMLDKNSKSFKSYLDDNLQSLASTTQNAVLELKKEEAIMHNLLNTRESISGVNIDEEMSALVAYQHGYSASARFITFIDRMLDTIINRMGV